MSLTHNKYTKKATLSILDPKERKQREMWGTFCIFTDTYIFSS